VAERTAEETVNEAVFSTEEKDMIHGVLTLAERSARSIMTPRTDIVWLDLDKPREEQQRCVIEIGHSRLPDVRGSLAEFVGIARPRDHLRRKAKSIWNARSASRSPCMRASTCSS